MAALLEKGSFFMNRIVTACLFLCVGATLAVAQQPLLDVERGTSMFSDIKAHRVGDIITILIRENTVAVSNASTATDTKNEISGGEGEGPLGFVPLFGLDTKTKFQGDGSTERSGQIQTEMTATIVEVLANGNLRIEGKRGMKINGELETVIVSGVVRAKDISAHNRIHSTQIADASITYNGKGTIESAHQPGWITRIVNWVF